MFQYLTCCTRVISSNSILFWASFTGKETSPASYSRRSRSYFTTDGQSVCLGVEPTLGLVTRYYFLWEGCCLKIAVLFLWGALSDERTGLQFAVQSLNSPSHANVTVLYCLIWDSPNLGGQVTISISLRNMVAQLYHRSVASLYVAFYDSQGCGGGILTRLHTG
jgi:hypothetical protein